MTTNPAHPLPSRHEMRDRTNGRVSTPLSDLTSAVVGDTGRRFAVAAMTSGVALTSLVSTVQTPDVQEPVAYQPADLADTLDLAGTQGVTGLSGPGNLAWGRGDSLDASVHDTGIFDREAMTSIEARIALQLNQGRSGESSQFGESYQLQEPMQGLAASQPAITVSADALVERTEWVDGGAMRTVDATAAPIPRHYDQVGRVSTASRAAGRSADNYAEYRELAQQGTAERNYAAALVALRHLGVPYVWGGTTPAGFDCSGLVQYAFAQVGVDLPRTTQAIGASAAVTAVSPQDAQPGDLVWRPTHVSIYLGDGLMVEASRPGSPVWVRELWHPSSQFLRVTG